MANRKPTLSNLTSSFCGPQGGGWPIRLTQSIALLLFFLKAGNTASAMLTPLEPLGDAVLMKRMVTEWMEDHQCWSSHRLVETNTTSFFITRVVTHYIFQAPQKLHNLLPLYNYLPHLPPPKKKSLLYMPITLNNHAFLLSNNVNERFCNIVCLVSKKIKEKMKERDKEESGIY